jgi:hypothetical protein
MKKKILERRNKLWIFNPVLRIRLGSGSRREKNYPKKEKNVLSDLRVGFISRSLEVFEAKE